MDELIKIKSRDYGEYENLLLKRDALRKEAHLLQLEYTRIFGALITDVFKIKIECIKKKKTITFCQTALNKGNKINRDEMNAWIASEMKEYNDQLRKMIEENEIANSGTTISKKELSLVKQLYHKLAKLLHPDINPKTDVIPELKRLWHMIVVSYNANSLKDLQEAEVLVKYVLSANDIKNFEIEISNLTEKIESIREEIYQIKLTNPYQYKYFLSDEDAVQQKTNSLKSELKEYKDYSEKLDAIIDGLFTNGMNLSWRMN